MIRSKGLASTAVVALFASSVSYAYAETMIVTTMQPPTHWGSIVGGEPFMACVEEATSGEIDFNYFPSGQIAGFAESLSAVNDGLAQISYIVVSAQTDRLPLNGISMLPEMGDTVAEMTNAYRKVLDEGGLLSEEFTANRVHPLIINMFPPVQINTATEPLDTLEKLQGRKIASGGGALTIILKALGTTGIEMASADLYLAAQTGTIDGVMLALASMKPYNLQEVFTSMSSNASFGSGAGVWGIDLAVWEGLTPEKQQTMTECALKIESSLAAYADNLTEELKVEFAALGINVYEFSPEALAALGERLEVARQEYISRLVARDLPAQEAFDEYKAALGR